MEPEIRYRKILIATDGSEPALHAAKHAIYLAKGLGSAVLVLNVVDTGEAFHAGVHYAEDLAELEQSGAAAVAAVKTLCDEAGVPATTLVARGTPQAAILRAAADEGADLIVLGTVGMSALERALLGSVSEHVLHQARCPVLLVRE